jgi:hypothetical protein
MLLLHGPARCFLPYFCHCISVMHVLFVTIWPLQLMQRCCTIIIKLLNKAVSAIYVGVPCTLTVCTIGVFMCWRGGGWETWELHAFHIGFHESWSFGSPLLTDGQTHTHTHTQVPIYDRTLFILMKVQWLIIQRKITVDSARLKYDVPSPTRWSCWLTSLCPLEHLDHSF